MSLTLSDLSLLSRLFDEGLALPVAQREPWLQALPPAQRHLAPRLRRMLESHERHTDALAVLPSLEACAAAHAGERVGPWQLEREIGRGGMGSVWLAARADGAYERRVALKLPRIAWAENLGRRMARERRIGALLEHPAIARLYDAGLDEHGRPFIAMEYVEGKPIDRHCRAAGLAPRAVVALFLQVVRAVAYAHGRLVVHRDLKPSNVLVSADGQAHLLDFGIAALLDNQPAEARLTQEQGRAATLLYAAPEQLRGEPATVQADVYGLGVLLHELLSGELPQQGVAARALRGDLSAIVAKALRDDPAARYGSADALAADLQHWLDGEPVSARPDPWLFRVVRWLRRHRVAALSGVVISLALGVGGGLALLQSLRAQEAAQREHAMRGFVAEVFSLPQPRALASGELGAAPAEAFLERSADVASRRLMGQPALRAELYALMGASFSDMGAYRLASEYARRRLAALGEASAGASDRARATLQLAETLLDQTAWKPARVQAQAALALAEDAPALRIQALLLMARIAAASDDVEAAKASLERLAATPRSSGEDGAVMPWVQGVRAWLSFREGHIDGAVTGLNRAIERALQVDGPESLVAVELRLMATRILAATVRRAEASQYFAAADAALRRRGGNHAIRAAVTAAEYAAIRYRSGFHLRPADVLEEVARARALLSAAGWALPAEMSARLDRAEATAHIWSGEAWAGLPLMERAMAVLYDDAPVAERRLMASAMGFAFRDAGRHDEADRMLRDALRMRVEALGADHPYAVLDLTVVVDNLGMAGRFAEALALLDAVPANRETSGDGARHPQRMRLWTQMWRSRILLDMGSGPAALAAFPRPLMDEPSDRAEAWPLMGELLCRTGRAAEGLPVLEAGQQALAERGESERSPWTARLQAVVGECALKVGRRALAQRSAQRARETLRQASPTSPYFHAPLLRLEAALAGR